MAPRGMTHCWQHERALKLLDLVEHGRMNAMRIHGGNEIPPQEFYDECDRRGILLWQDFMFAGVYPNGRPDFDENCRLEIEGMIKRLRNHPSLLLWCGGNEGHMHWGYKHGTEPTVGANLFDQIMPGACAKLDPTRLYHKNSPYGGRSPNWPLEGDWHDYTTLTFSPMASVPLFVTETGRASAPSLTSMQKFMSKEYLWPEAHDPVVKEPGKPAWPDMWGYRASNGAWDKIGAIENYLEPNSAADLIRVLGTAHGDYLQNRIERQRRGAVAGKTNESRRCWGNLVWRLNDSWPIVYWSVVDYYLEPKIAYYYLRRAYAPVLLSFEKSLDEIKIWVINDSPDPVSGTLHLSRRRFNGESRGELETYVELEPGEAKPFLETTNLGSVLQWPVFKRDEYLYARLDTLESTLLLMNERYLHLPHADLTVFKVDENTIELQTPVFTRQISLQMTETTGAVFEDNYFDLPPGKRKIRIVDSGGGEQLHVKALNADTIHVPFE